MSDPAAPDRLWVCPLLDWDSEGLNWDEGSASLETNGSPADTEYVRADLHEAQVTALTAQRDALTEALVPFAYAYVPRAEAPIFGDASHELISTTLGDLRRAARALTDTGDRLPSEIAAALDAEERRRRMNAAVETRLADKDPGDTGDQHGS